MTVRPLSKVRIQESLSVIEGGRRSRRPVLAPWMIVAIIALAGFLGMGFARTSLDNSAFELAELNRDIAQQTAHNQQLNLEIARLESPASIAPLAEELGLIVPSETKVLLVDLEPTGPALAEADDPGRTQ